jgi:hypothetical protein
METPGSLIDKLVIVNLKIFKAEDVKREPDASDKTIADATRLTNKLNKHRNELIGELDEMFGYNNVSTTKMYGK